MDQTWYILYTEQRNGHAFIWQQKFYATNQLQNNATPVRERAPVEIIFLMIESLDLVFIIVSIYSNKS
jgi:hypothetical protein